MSQNLEHLILRELCSNFSFRQKALPHMREDYFDNVEARKVLSIIHDYVQKYKGNVINFDIVGVELENQNLDEGSYKKAKDLLSSIKTDTQSVDTAWMLDKAEQFCKQKAIFNALHKSVDLYDKNKKGNLLAFGAIPGILQDALKVSFDTSLGHDYWSDAELAFDHYTNFEGHHVPFNLKHFDLITQGGLLRKTLNVIIAGTGGGKTMLMCSQAANYLMQGLNVLYLTGEMDQFKIRERIDANLLDIEVNALRHMSKTVFMQRQKKLHSQSKGRLKIMEFEEGGATTALMFSNWIEQLAQKDDFVPDVIIIDYLTLMGSSRVKLAQGSYALGKAVSEEVRALARRHNAVVLTGAQFNRGGMDNSDPGLGNTSESVGIPFTADLILAIINTGELGKRKQACIKQLKNRYNDENFYNKFIIGVDKPKMRFFDVEDSAQLAADKISDDGEEDTSSKIKAYSNKPKPNFFL